MSDLMPKPTAHVAPYVEVLGVDLTVTFLLAFGGAEIYLPSDRRSRSRVADLIGRKKAAALAKIGWKLPRRVPLAKPWIAAVLHAKGLSKSDIARKLHVSDVTVRAYLKGAGKPSKARRDPDDGPTQLSLF